MFDVKSLSSNQQRATPFQPHLSDDPGFLLGSVLTALLLAGFVLIGLAWLGVFQ
ncbi:MULTISPECIES: hypothetical protein [Phyllobacteriaceae]|jgi:hypothetical protein|uniref:hypothetical protein n=1 Tax=Phyllobacteriaceae TaxID=69277 RepID=UPI0004BA9C35|nr:MULTISPECIES: hypothetical protein [Mesorhizobium]MBN9232734.1 hypothetical protein [Mesorhizobium sp.]MDQ0330333.1 hypothetical protein [Mesorhizobium sp. YL-MeA3-2017]